MISESLLRLHRCDVHFVVTVVAQEDREDDETCNGREDRRYDCHPKVASSALRVQYAVCPLKGDEEIKLPDSDCQENCNTDHRCGDTGKALLSVTHSLLDFRDALSD